AAARRRVVVLDVVEDERLADAGPLRQPHDGAELDVPVDLGVDFGELALRLERIDKAAQIAEGDSLSFGGDVLGAGLEHEGPYSTRARALARDMQSARLGNALALARRDLDRVDDLGIGGAAAEITREVVPNLLLVRIGMRLQQLRRHQHEARRAVRALEGAGLDEGFLHGIEIELVGVRERFDRPHLGAVDEGGQVEAAGDGHAVHQHGAAAAQALAAALARAHQIEFALQQLDEVVMRLDLGRDLLAVEGGADRVRHSSSPSGLLALARSARSSASALSGSEVRRTPQASSMALAIAGDTQNVAVSPTPLAPNGPFD